MYKPAPALIIPLRVSFSFYRELRNFSKDIYGVSGRTGIEISLKIQISKFLCLLIQHDGFL